MHIFVIPCKGKYLFPKAKNLLNMKLQYTLVFLLLTLFTYGQKSTLYQNVNVRANELKHNLNKTGDSLIFKCERTVYEVVVFNDDFERVIKVRDTDAKIPIADIPVGRYIVEALLSDKLIVMTLLRNESFDLQETSLLITDSSDLFGTKSTPKKEEISSVEVAVELPEKEEVILAITEPKPLSVNEEFSEENVNINTDLAVAGKKAKPERETLKPSKTILTRKPATSSLSFFKNDVQQSAAPKRSTGEVDNARANRVVSTYWVEYIINNGQNSQKMQKLGDQDTVDRMIRKIEIDMKTKAGRLNELVIWTVYDPPKFVIHKRINKGDFTKVPSESYQSEPYYRKINDPDDL